MSRLNNRRHRLPSLPKATTPVNNIPRIAPDIEEREVKWKLSILRIAYNNEKRKVEQSKRSGAPVETVHKPKLKYYDYMDSVLRQCSAPARNVINSIQSVPQDKYADCWQSKLNTVAERNRYILDHSLFTDCSFLVGRDPQKLFKCHKLFLAQCSAALEALLYGPEKVTNFPIALPDVHPDAFQHMLDYMYCDELKLLDREQVEALMYVCKKYNVRYLVAKCQKFLCASSTRNTVRAM